MNPLLSLLRHSFAGLRVLLLMTVLLGVVYPLVITGVAQAVFPQQANGSLITSTGQATTNPADAVGSSLVGQVATADLFQPRASAAGEGYDPLNTYGSNLGPESPELIAAIQARRSEIAAREGISPEEIPADALTASASGLDPHISPAYAELQVARVATANELTQQQVRDLVRENTTQRSLGVLGAARVNVLELNIDVLAARER